jgi:hypothetical protein
MRGLSGLLLLLVAGVAGTIGPAAGQEPAPPPPTLEGRLYVGESPADSGTVVLHRVTPEEAGPVDSTRVEQDGEFRIPLPGIPEPGSGEIFFASVRHEGILYFGDPITGPQELGDPYRIQAYPTREAPPGGIPFAVSVRNIFLEEGPLGWQLTDLFEIRNDSAVTFVAGPAGEALWSHPLPPGARGLRIGQGEPSPDALRFRDGALEVVGPIPPGERLFVVQYDLEEVEFTVPLTGRTDFLEILLREPGPSLRMEGVSPQPPVEMEPGSSYLRWAGEGFEDRVIRVRKGEEGEELLTGWVVLILALTLALAGIWAVRRRGGWSSVPPAPPTRGRREILLEIARLDEEFGDPEDRSPDEVARYRERRESLLASLDEEKEAGREARSAP